MTTTKQLHEFIYAVTVLRLAVDCLVSILTVHACDCSMLVVTELAISGIKDQLHGVYYNINVLSMHVHSYCYNRFIIIISHSYCHAHGPIILANDACTMYMYIDK